MRKSGTISDLMLERFNLGEISGEEKIFIESRLAGDPALSSRLADIRRSDMELRNGRLDGAFSGHKRRNFPGSRFAPLVWGACAAAVLVLVLLPFMRKSPETPLTDRSKGISDLSVYLKTDGNRRGGSDETGVKVTGNMVLKEGSTIQLAYLSLNASHGVIFSIDGRAAVTMHYPYRMNGSTSLVSGKLTALEEAYTLDDAPDFETFFFILGDQPMDVRNIMASAEKLALNPRNAEAQCRKLFADYEVKTVTILKE
ncbi:hypothetical protein LJC14_00145 [Treponema sp. OttesenSCG-928-L16]|nr:hypothetical protein [Treponema sp. OttesenSCG-928-L16]